MDYLLAYNSQPLINQSDFTKNALKKFNETMAQFDANIGRAKLTYPITIQLTSQHIIPASKTDLEIKEQHAQSIMLPCTSVVTSGELEGQWTIYRTSPQSKSGNGYDFNPLIHTIDFSNGKAITLQKEDKILLFYLVFVCLQCEVLRDSFGNQVLTNQRDLGQSPSYKIINEYQTIVDTSEMEEIIQKAKSYLYGDSKINTELLNAVAYNYHVGTANKDRKIITETLRNIIFGDYEKGKQNAIEKVQQFITVVSDYDFLKVKMAVSSAIEKKLITMEAKGTGNFKAWFYSNNGVATNLLCNMPMIITDDREREDYITKFLMERPKERGEFYEYLKANGIKVSRIEVLTNEKEEETIDANSDERPEGGKRGRPSSK